MRWMLFIAWTGLISLANAAAETDSRTSSRPAPKTPTSLPAPKAEPQNSEAYAPPAPRPAEGPSEADVGPVQRHFIRASKPDDLATTQNDDNAAMAIKDKIAFDKRLTVPLIHDVQNDGPGSASDNHALQGELEYLNWGAVTNEQILARRGHYFTITWDNDGPKADFVARFQYREVRSKEIVRTLTQEAKNIKGATRSYFAVVDKAYEAYGPVVSWRFTVLKGDTVVAEAKSFIW